MNKNKKKYLTLKNGIEVLPDAIGYFMKRGDSVLEKNHSNYQIYQEEVRKKKLTEKQNKGNQNAN